MLRESIGNIAMRILRVCIAIPDRSAYAAAGRPVDKAWSDRIAGWARFVNQVEYQ